MKESKEFAMWVVIVIFFGAILMAFATKNATALAILYLAYVIGDKK